MDKYTCGFIFHNDDKNILLIQKQRPKWQTGKLNGIGGKIEPFDKSAVDGWIREVNEEADVDLSQQRKIYNFCRLCGTNYSIEFFRTHFKDLVNFRSKTDEYIVDIPIKDIHKYNLISNLTWLIEMAKESQSYPNMYRVINE